MFCGSTGYLLVEHNRTAACCILIDLCIHLIVCAHLLPNCCGKCAAPNVVAVDVDRNSRCSRAEDSDIVAKRWGDGREGRDTCKVVE